MARCLHEPRGFPGRVVTGFIGLLPREGVAEVRQRSFSARLHRSACFRRRPNPRKQREDKRILLGFGHRGKVDRGAHNHLESSRP